MAKFSYRLVTKDNKVITGSVEAWSKIGARKKIEHKGSTVLFIIPDRTSRAAKASFLSLTRFSMVEKIDFFRNLSNMIAAGMSVADALRVIQEQGRKKKTREVFTAMISDIENGQRLSETMRKHKKYFSEFLVETVAVGEVAGTLVETLDRISNDLQYRHDLNRMVMTSLAYPFIVIMVMLAVMVTLMVYVLPQVAKLFYELGAPIPLPTRILLSLSAFIQNYPIQIGIAITLLTIATILILKTKKGHYVFSYIVLKTPIFGKLIKEKNLALFFRTLEALFASGISLMRSVEIGAKTLKNDVYRNTLTNFNPILVHGTNLSEVLKPFPFLFPLQLQRIIEVGEQSGKLEESFKNLNAYYDRAVRHRTEMLTATLEPVVLVIAGLGVAGLALSLFLPLYESIQVL